jgi:hypothetical protein
MRTVLAALVLLTATAYADGNDTKKMADSDCARARAQNRTCVIDMGDEKIEGEPPVSSGTKVDVLTYVGNSSLINIRHDFIPEILKTAEDL